MEINLYDFSKTNVSKESRVDIISKIASICYGNEECSNPNALYTRLLTEGAGKSPASTLEFIPVVVPVEELYRSIKLKKNIGNMYGMVIGNYYLSNLREMYNLIPKKNKYDYLPFIYNVSEYEQNIIKNNFFVFKQKVPKYIAVQDMRHRRASYQEISRRYVKDSKVPFEFNSIFNGEYYHLTKNYFEEGVDLYHKLLEKHSAQEARAVIPYGFMTEYWSCYLRDSFENMLELRTSSHSQPEMRKLATIREELVITKKYK